MRKNKNKIPINTMGDMLNLGISIDRNNLKKSYFATAQQAEDAAQAHRDEGYTFHILEKGKVVIEIDFKTYNVSAPAVVYLHPDQVHRMLDIDDIIVSSLSINSENLNTEYLNILQELQSNSSIFIGKTSFLHYLEQLLSLSEFLRTVVGNIVYCFETVVIH
ncbi:AraC family ligand binding domain-containing protein [Pedobacter sp.]|uniref:AraC family ligand binding domain-containing protein n=1 Tax=Pedobacter sp. TaxID=1411316 RepID=UPI003C5E6A76